MSINKESNMKKSRILASGLVLCLCFVFANSLFAQDVVKSTVTSIEKSLWEAWKNKDMTVFEKNLTEDAVNITSQGVNFSREQYVKELTAHPCEVRNFSLSDWQVREISSDTVLVTYKAKQDATCEGMKVPANIVASAVYVKKNGKWLAASYHESPSSDASGLKAE
ncbi:MAG: nuclear transport factor 2 family protein [Acidobacteria bacterium]|nr:MAG: nuclear transport factor 2 family protein [Acidobacteriota bacterium]